MMIGRRDIDLANTSLSTEHAPYLLVSKDLDGDIHFTKRLHLCLRVCVCERVTLFSWCPFDTCHTSAGGSGVKVDHVHSEAEPLTGSQGRLTFHTQLLTRCMMCLDGAVCFAAVSSEHPPS